MKASFSTKEALFAAAQRLEWQDITVLVCSKLGGGLTELPPLPHRLRVLECKNNPYLDLGSIVFPETLEELFCCGRQYGGPSLAPVAHTQLRKLYLCRTATTALPDMPVTLEELQCNNCPLEELPDLAHTQLVELRAERARLSAFPSFPKGSIEGVYLANNQIADLPIDLEEYVALRFLYLQRNRLTVLPQMPATIEELYLCGNKLENGLPALEHTALRELYATSCRMKVALTQLPTSMEELCVEHNPDMPAAGNLLPATVFFTGVA